MKIVFLDFDGVLINRWSLRQHSGEEAPADPRCVAVLNEITSVPGSITCIVVTTSWRYGKSVAEIRDLLHGWGVQGAVIGKTPRLPTGASRSGEIEKWLKDWSGWRGTPESYVILDDDRTGHLDGRLVQCDNKTGLVAMDLPAALATLARRLPEYVRELEEQEGQSNPGTPVDRP